NAYLYIPTDRYLVVVDTVLKKYIGNIYTGFANSTVALNPENKRSVVLGFHTKEAAIFDMSSFGVVDTVKLDGSPVSGTISSNPELSAYVFIAETQSNAVSVISLESSDERKAQSIPLALIPYKIMAHPRTDKIYVLGRDEGITVLARSNKAGELVQIRATVPYPSAPGEELSDAVFNQDGSLLYLLMNQVGSGSPSKILQFDSLNNTISSLIENADSENLLYIFSDASLAYIPKSQGKTVKLLRLAEEVATVADSSRDGKERYLVNAQDNTVLLRSEGQEDSLIEIPYSISSFNTDVLGPIITKGRLVASEELVSFVSHADKEGRVSRKIEFTNTGFLPIKTSTPTLEGRDWSRFTFSSSNCHGRTLINGESCELTVDFLGTDDGQYEAELVLLTGEDDLSLSRVMLTAESRPVEKSSAGMLNVFVLTVLYLVLTGIRRRNLSIPETKLTRTLKPAA
ncbi:MAG: hypothetical protein OEX00_08090, partial [Gammaproteobacteria bacterium]|nr:hypothetical protein [Gammaproteobacteria bacterium]